MIVELSSAKDQDGWQVGVQVKFKKDIAMHFDPLRAYIFNNEAGKMVLLAGGLIFESCEEGIKQNLFNT